MALIYKLSDLSQMSEERLGWLAAINEGKTLISGLTQAQQLFAELHPETLEKLYNREED